MDFLNKLLNFYNIDLNYYKKYLINDIDFSILEKFKTNKDLIDVSNLINESIKNNEKIIIYGDYDCDGICSISILYLSILKKNYSNVFYYLPSRKNDGYGLTLENAKKIIDNNYQLVILVDNGISLFDQIKLLRDSNVKVLIIDHHEYEDKLPNSNKIIHWKSSNISDLNMSAGMLSFIFSYVFLDYIDNYLLSLGMITLLSDSMPLIKINRDLVRLGLNVFNKDKNSKITSLLDNKKEFYNEEDINLNFIPKINSIGRIINNKDSQLIIKYLTSEDTNYSIIKWINKVNIYRKNIINNYVIKDDELNNKYMNFIITDLDEGLIGLLANKVMSINNLPTFILTCIDNDELYKGSSRLPNVDFNLYNLLSSYKDIFNSLGGHSNACGFSIHKSKIDEFKKLLNDSFEKINLKPKSIDSIEIDYKDINFYNLDILNSFRPFGMNFDKPKFILKDVPSRTLNFSKDNNHILFNINNNSKFIYFNYPKELLLNSSNDFIGYIEKNFFRNKISCDFKCINFIKNK